MQNNNQACIDKLKNEVKMNKISYVFDVCNSYSYYALSHVDYCVRCEEHIIKKKKTFQQFKCLPMILNNKTKRRNYFNNLAIDHVKLEFQFRFFFDYYGVTARAQLAILINFLKVMNTKKLTLTILISGSFYPRCDPFCKSLINILQKYCKHMRVFINYKVSDPDFIKKLRGEFNIKKKLKKNQYLNLKI